MPGAGALNGACASPLNAPSLRSGRGRRVGAGCVMMVVTPGGGKVGALIP
jgi:hypothetical protein